MQSTVKKNLQSVNTMADNKKSFILHLDSLEVLDELTPTQCGELLLAMRAYNEGNDVKLSGLLKAVFIPFRNQFDRDLEKYNSIVLRNRENGAKGGKPKGTQTNPLGILGTQANPNKPDNDSDSKKDSENGSENGKDENTGGQAPVKVFVKPSQDEIVNYVIQKNPTGNISGATSFAEVFFSHYENIGWKVGKNKMKDWKLAIVQWKETMNKHLFPNGIAQLPPEQRQVTPDLPNHKRGVEYKRSGIENRTFKGNYNEFLDAKGCTPDETFTIVREYVIG